MPYYKTIFSYIASTQLLTEEELLKKALNVITKTYDKKFNVVAYFRDQEFFQKFKELTLSMSESV
jgi:hypothetical protein